MVLNKGREIISKSLGYTVPEPITVNFGNLKEVNTSLKSTPMLGFLGTFSVNFFATANQTSLRNPGLLGNRQVGIEGIRDD